MSTFLHQAYDEATSTKQELQSVQFKVQIVSTPLPLSFSLIPPTCTCTCRLKVGSPWGIHMINFWIFMLILQLREVHESEMEKAYQLKAKIIEVRCVDTILGICCYYGVVWWFDHMRVSWGLCDSHGGQWVHSPCDKSFVRRYAPSLSVGRTCKMFPLNESIVWSLTTSDVCTQYGLVIVHVDTNTLV